MAVSYRKFLNNLLSTGISLNDLKSRGGITDYTYRCILNEIPINLKHVDAVCQYLKLPIEQVVEIIPDEEYSE